MKITARVSQFDNKLLPVENPIEFIKACRRKFGKPAIRFFRGAKTYDFIYMFDKVTIVVDRSERHRYN